MTGNIWRNIMILLIGSGIVSCHNNLSGEQGAGKSTPDMSKSAASAVNPELKKLTLDSKKDPACGMPISAGLEDTAHYNGKLYGFCSKECKEAFLKDPASFVFIAK